MCLHQSIPCHDIPTRGHLHSLHTYKRTFMPWHTLKRTFASWHTLKETFAFIAYPSRHLHSLHTRRKHLHHGILSRRHLHSLHSQGIFASWHTYMDICIMSCPLKGICTTRHFASTSLQDDICITIKYVRWHHHGSTLHLHPCMGHLHLRKKKAFALEMKNLDLHNILFAFIENWHLGQWWRVYQ